MPETETKPLACPTAAELRRIIDEYRDLYRRYQAADRDSDAAYSAEQAIRAGDDDWHVKAEAIAVAARCEADRSRLFHEMSEIETRLRDAVLAAHGYNPPPWAEEDDEPDWSPVAIDVGDWILTVYPDESEPRTDAHVAIVQPAGVLRIG